MATLTGNTIASTYTGLLSVTGAVGADTVEAVTDGAGTSTSLSLSQQRATITLGSGAADDFIVDGTTLVVEGDNNRVGIGTASPSYKLHVAEDLANDYAAYIINDNADGSGLRLRCDDSDGDEYLFYAENSTTARFAIKSDGKTGIGTASPGGVLQIDAGLGAPSDLGNFEEYHLILRDSGGNTNDAVGMLFTSSADTYGGSAIVHYDTGSGGTGDLVFYTKQSTSAVAPAEVMRLTDDGKVGIRTTNPGANLHTAHSSSTAYNGGAEILESIIIQNTNGSDDSGVNNVASLGLHVASGATSQGFINYVRTGNNTGDFTFSQRTGGSSYAEHMRILSGGNVCIARNSVLSPTAKLVVASALDGGTTPAMSVQANTSTSSGSVIVFHSGDGGECGAIGMSNLNAGNSVAYNTSSDYRLKQKVKTLPNGLNRVNQMKPVEFEWKKSKSKSEGFIAHELQEICDYAVMGEKDGDRMQQVDYAKITPILVKAVQELSAKVEALENA